MPRIVRRPSERAVPTRLALALASFVVLALLMPAGAAAKTVGVQTHSLWGGVSSDEVERNLDEVEAAGGKMIRADLGWSSLEQNAKGRYEGWYLDKVDYLVDRADAHGIELLLTVTDTPCWASSAPETLKDGCRGSWWSRGVQQYPPSDPGDYGDALAFLVDRYGDRVEGWEIWNEPNSRSFWKADDPARDYAELVRAAYPAAKDANPDATIIAGALSESDFEFTESLFRNGIDGSFDAFSIHPYSGDASPLDPLGDKYVRNSFIRGVPAVHDVMKRYGNDQPLWLTEFGWSTSDIRGEESWMNGVSEEKQAQYTEEAYAQMRKWDYVPVGIAYELQDIADDPDDRVSNFGLLRHDGSRKPAFDALRRAASGDIPPIDPPVCPTSGGSRTEERGSDAAADEDAPDDSAPDDEGDSNDGEESNDDGASDNEPVDEGNDDDAGSGGDDSSDEQEEAEEGSTEHEGEAAETETDDPAGEDDDSSAEPEGAEESSGDSGTDDPQVVKQSDPCASEPPDDGEGEPPTGGDGGSDGGSSSGGGSSGGGSGSGGDGSSGRGSSGGGGGGSSGGGSGGGGSSGGDPTPPPTGVPVGGASGVTPRGPGAVVVRILRRSALVRAVGSAPRGSVVRLKVYRYVAGRRTFSGRPTHILSVRVGESGRFARRLSSSVGRGRWRVTAAVVGVAARPASAYVR